MPGKFMSPKEAARFIELIGKPYRPVEILQLQEGIAGDTRALEFRVANGGSYTEEEIAKIAKKKLRVDYLCGL